MQDPAVAYIADKNEQRKDCDKGRDGTGLFIVARSQILVIAEDLSPPVLHHWSLVFIHGTRRVRDRCDGLWWGTRDSRARDDALEIIVEDFLHLVGVGVHPRVVLVVRPRVVEHEPPVLPEVCGDFVCVGRDTFPDRGHGNWLLDDLVIIRVYLPYATCISLCTSGGGIFKLTFLSGNSLKRSQRRRPVWSSQLRTAL